MLMDIFSEPTLGSRPFLREQSTSAVILVVEDPFVSSFLRTILQRRGHKVIVGEPDRVSGLLRDGRLEALVVITNRPEAFLPLADTLPMLYIAANPDPALAIQFPICRVLRKPFRNDDLLEAVEELAHSVVP